MLLVVGGWNGYVYLASVESVTYHESAMDPWTLHPDSLLPARDALRAASIGGTVYVTGGYNGHTYRRDDGTYLSDIQTWDPEHSSWSKVGDMAVGRASHAVTVVDYDVISQYCVHPTTSAP